MQLSYIAANASKHDPSLIVPLCLIREAVVRFIKLHPKTPSINPQQGVAWNTKCTLPYFMYYGVELSIEEELAPMV